MENRGHDEPDDVEFIVWDLVQNRFISASSDLAEVIQNSVSASLGLPNRGVRKAIFYVLLTARVPGVLTEVSFISHPKGEAANGKVMPLFRTAFRIIQWVSQETQPVTLRIRVSMR